MGVWIFFFGPFAACSAASKCQTGKNCIDTPNTQSASSSKNPAKALSAPGPGTAQPSLSRRTLDYPDAPALHKYLWSTEARKQPSHLHPLPPPMRLWCAAVRSFFASMRLWRRFELLLRRLSLPCCIHLPAH